MSETARSEHVSVREAVLDLQLKTCPQRVQASV